MIRDREFERIELTLKEPNIFRSLSIERKELRHSNFIAYILNPNESHGLGDVVIRKLMRDIFSDEKATDRDIFDADGLDLLNIEIRREWRNIDLLIILGRDVVVIENKVDSADHSDQLKKYFEIANASFPGKKIHFVYLTPFGNDPQDENFGKLYINYSYLQLAEIIDSIIDLYKNKLSQKVFFYLSDYLLTVKRELLMNDKPNEWAANVYKAHKEAFDFIIENKPDPASILYPYFLEAIKREGFAEGSKNKGYLRFTTQSLKKLLPENVAEGWPGKEIFLFEIDYFWSDKSAKFKAVIAPSNDPVREKLHAALKGLKEYKAPYGKKWLVFFHENFPFVASDIINEEEDEIRKKVNGIIVKIKPKVLEISDFIERGLAKD